jgi:hypothetical protein
VRDKSPSAPASTPTQPAAPQSAVTAQPQSAPAAGPVAAQQEPQAATAPEQSALTASPDASSPAPTAATSDQVGPTRKAGLGKRRVTVTGRGRRSTMEALGDAQRPVFDYYGRDDRNWQDSAADPHARRSTSDQWHARNNNGDRTASRARSRSERSLFGDVFGDDRYNNSRWEDRQR